MSVTTDNQSSILEVQDILRNEIEKIDQQVEMLQLRKNQLISASNTLSSLAQLQEQKKIPEKIEVKVKIDSVKKSNGKPGTKTNFKIKKCDCGAEYKYAIPFNKHIATCTKKQSYYDQSIDQKKIK